AFLLFIPMAPVAAVPVLWIAMIMLCATLGELSLAPVGLSLTTKLAPSAFPVLMMALYNLSVALGTSLSGALAQFYSAENEAAYSGTLGALTISIRLLMLRIARPARRPALRAGPMGRGGSAAPPRECMTRRPEPGARGPEPGARSPERRIP